MRWRRALRTTRPPLLPASGSALCTATDPVAQSSACWNGAERRELGHQGRGRTSSEATRAVSSGLVVRLQKICTMSGSHLRWQIGFSGREAVDGEEKEDPHSHDRNRALRQREAASDALFMLQLTSCRPTSGCRSTRRTRLTRACNRPRRTPSTCRSTMVFRVIEHDLHDHPPWHDGPNDIMRAIFCFHRPKLAHISFRQSTTGPGYFMCGMSCSITQTYVRSESNPLLTILFKSSFLQCPMTSNSSETG